MCHGVLKRNKQLTNTRRCSPKSDSTECKILALNTGMVEKCVMKRVKHDSGELLTAAAVTSHDVREEGRNMPGDHM